jgi:hypothetical protein
MSLMSAHALLAIICHYIRNEGPQHHLKITATSGALVLFGQNSLRMTTYKLFKEWSDLENYLQQNKLRLPRIVEASQLPPAQIQIEALGSEEGRPEYKILWSRNGNDRNVLHVPDLKSAQVFRDYVYFQGLEPSHLGHSLSIIPLAPQSSYTN